MRVTLSGSPVAAAAVTFAGGAVPSGWALPRSADMQAVIASSSTLACRMLAEFAQIPAHQRDNPPTQTVTGGDAALILSWMTSDAVGRRRPPRMSTFTWGDGFGSTVAP